MSTDVSIPILVVDDDLDAGQNLRDILADLGYDVSVATDGFGALELARERQFEIALVDLKMPGMDGLTLASKLKELSPSVVVILTTAFANRATLATSQSHGIRRVFAKPLDLRQVIPYLLDISEQPLVLLIDDDIDAFQSLRDVLDEQGYRSGWASTIAQAVAQVRRQQFRVILLDMKLPDGFGDEVYWSIRELAPEVRVVLVTGYRHEMEDRVNRTLAEGADAVCYKPFQFPELLETLRKLTAARLPRPTN